MSAANRGDEAAFDAIYHRYKEWVVSLATRLTGDADLALDVLQETFLYLLSKFPDFKLTSRLTTFLYPAVKNLAIAQRRKKARLSGSPDALEVVPAPAAAQANELTAVIAALPLTHSEVVLMRFGDGLSLEEISQALQIPLGTVKSRLHNALNMLRENPKVAEFFAP